MHGNAGFLTGPVSRPGKAETFSYLVPRAHAEEAPAPVPTCTVSWPAGDVDMDKLAYAVGMYETTQCTNPNSPTANARNNCHGIMTYVNGKRTPRSFASTADSAAYFKTIWQKLYGGFPTLAQARTYSGNDRACTWLKQVHRFYTQ